MNSSAASHTRFVLGRLSIVLLVLVSFLLAPTAFAQTPIAFGKSFAPATIGPGSVTTLKFTIVNSSSAVVGNLAVVDVLPAAVTIANPASVTSTCNGTLDAPAGGNTISLVGGAVGANGSCSFSIDVTSASPGTHTNVSGSLTSELGSHGAAAADLTVTTDRPGFAKSFSPTSVTFGGRSTMTFTIDNTANPAGATSLNFTDNLPVGMQVASPAILVNTCGGTLSAPAGGSTVALSGFFPNPATVAAGATCTISVDVLGNSVGDLANVTGELTSTPPTFTPTRSSGKAGAVLTVTNDRILLEKSFIDDPTPPGETVTLRFEVRNRDRSDTATSIEFTDDLDAVLAGLAAIDTPVGDPCGAGSSLTGTDVLSLTGGSLGPGASCAFEVTLLVPVGASPASYLNATSDVTADLGGRSISAAGAADLLVVAPVPRLSMAFTDDPVGGGGSVTLEYSLANTSPTDSASELTFSNTLDPILIAASSIPAGGFCGGASTLSFIPANTFSPSTITVSGAELAPGASCTFSLVLDVAVGAPAGFYTNVTSEVMGTVGGEKLIGNPASDVLEVAGGLRLRKEFTDDPVAPGDPVTLEFSLSHDQIASGDAVDIAFTDDLDAVLAGLVAVDTPLAGICGAGSEIVGTSLLSFSAGQLAPGETCTFSVTLQVPAAPPGTYRNTTSNVVATVAGQAFVGNAAAADLRIAGLTLGKEFVDDPALPGGTATLRFSIENINPVEDASGILFFDNLEDVLPGLVAVGLPVNDVCGPGSTISGTGFLELQNASLPAGTSCIFDVTLQVPSAAEDGQYDNVTTGFSGVFGGTRIAFDNASDSLAVQRDFLRLTKTFIDDPVSPGDPVTLRFELTNLSADGPATSIAFTDDLEAALSGLAGTSGTQTDICGTGSEISGTSILTFTGGTLPGNASCSFDVSLQVPSTVPLGAEALNITSAVSGQIAGVAVEGRPASDFLEIDSVEFAKQFDGPSQAGSTVTLTFTIQNLDPTEGLEGLKFFDDLSAGLPGLAATGLPVSDVCGPGSLLESEASGTFVVFSGGSLLPAGSCSFPVTLQVPASAAPGSFPNVTSELTANGLPVADPAEDTLIIEGVTDSDGDGVLDALDVCPNTLIPEGVPTVRLGVNRFALVDDDGIFDTAPRRRILTSALSSNARPDLTFTIEDTAGCSCEQIIEAQGLGKGHVKFGCSIGAMREWIDLVNP